MTATAVLTSGGLDSAALLAETASTGVAYPIYVEAGMVWESGEKASLDRFVAALDSPNVRSVTYLSLQVAPLLSGHWSVTGQGIPDSDAPDEEMYIPGRNILLIGLAAGMVQHSRCEPGGHRFAGIQSIPGCNSRHSSLRSQTC